MSVNSLETKENIKSLKNGLELTRKFNPITYDTTDSLFKNQKNLPGLIAEDVLQFYPEIVKLNEKKEIIGINYIKIIPLLLSAIKELDNSLKISNNKIKELDAKTKNNYSDSELSFLNIFKK